MRTLLTFLLSLPLFAANPPEGFRALFDGQSLAGWYGWNPHQTEKLTGEKKTANLARQRAEFAQHWRVEHGQLVGHAGRAHTSHAHADGHLTGEAHGP